MLSTAIKILSYSPKVKKIYSTMLEYFRPTVLAYLLTKEFFLSHMLYTPGAMISLQIKRGVPTRDEKHQV